MRTPREHGGGLDAVIFRRGGSRAEWIDLSTGINPWPWPHPAPLPPLPAESFTRLPDGSAFARLETAARRFWKIPAEAAVLPAHGASALIALIPSLAPPGRVAIDPDTYNEHAAAFRHWGWRIVPPGDAAEAAVFIHPDNPTGRTVRADDIPELSLVVIDESFCDTMPEKSLIALSRRPGIIILKSFGKFWGLAGLRLGFAIGHPETLAPLAERTGPWAVSGAALATGAEALADTGWAETARARLERGARRLDRLLEAAGARVLGGTPLFRLVEVADADLWQAQLEERRIHLRRFSRHPRRLRFGLPGPDTAWQRLEETLAELGDAG